MKTTETTETQRTPSKTKKWNQKLHTCYIRIQPHQREQFLNKSFLKQILQSRVRLEEYKSNEKVPSETGLPVNGTTSIINNPHLESPTNDESSNNVQLINENNEITSGLAKVPVDVSLQENATVDDPHGLENKLTSDDSNDCLSLDVVNCASSPQGSETNVLKPHPLKNQEDVPENNSINFLAHESELTATENASINTSDCPTPNDTVQPVNINNENALADLNKRHDETENVTNLKNLSVSSRPSNLHGIKDNQKSSSIENKDDSKSDEVSIISETTKSNNNRTNHLSPTVPSSISRLQNHRLQEVNEVQNTSSDSLLSASTSTDIERTDRNSDTVVAATANKPPEQSKKSNQESSSSEMSWRRYDGEEICTSQHNEELSQTNGNNNVAVHHHIGPFNKDQVGLQTNNKPRKRRPIFDREVNLANSVTTYVPQCKRFFAAPTRTLLPAPNKSTSVRHNHPNPNSKKHKSQSQYHHQINNPPPPNGRTCPTSCENAGPGPSNHQPPRQPFYGPHPPYYNPRHATSVSTMPHCCCCHMSHQHNMPYGYPYQHHYYPPMYHPYGSSSSYYPTYQNPMHHSFNRYQQLPNAYPYRYPVPPPSQGGHSHSSSGFNPYFSQQSSTVPPPPVPNALVDLEGNSGLHANLNPPVPTGLERQETVTTVNNQANQIQMSMNISLRQEADSTSTTQQGQGQNISTLPLPASTGTFPLNTSLPTGTSLPQWTASNDAGVVTQNYVNSSSYTGGLIALKPSATSSSIPFTTSFVDILTIRPRTDSAQQATSAQSDASSKISDGRCLNENVPTIPANNQADLSREAIPSKSFLPLYGTVGNQSERSSSSNECTESYIEVVDENPISPFVQIQHTNETQKRTEEASVPNPNASTATETAIRESPLSPYVSLPQTSYVEEASIVSINRTEVSVLNPNVSTVTETVIIRESILSPQVPVVKSPTVEEIAVATISNEPEIPSSQILPSNTLTFHASDDLAEIETEKEVTFPTVDVNAIFTANQIEITEDAFTDITESIEDIERYLNSQTDNQPLISEFQSAEENYSQANFSEDQEAKNDTLEDGRISLDFLFDDDVDLVREKISEVPRVKNNEELHEKVISPFVSSNIKVLSSPETNQSQKVELSSSPASSNLDVSNAPETSRINTVHIQVLSDFLQSWGSTFETIPKTGESLKDAQSIDLAVVPMRCIGKTPEVDISIRNSLLGIDHHVTDSILSELEETPKTLKKTQTSRNKKAVKQANLLAKYDLKECTVNVATLLTSKLSKVKQPNEKRKASKLKSAKKSSKSTASSSSVSSLANSDQTCRIELKDRKTKKSKGISADKKKSRGNKNVDPYDVDQYIRQDSVSTSKSSNSNNLISMELDSNPVAVKAKQRCENKTPSAAKSHSQQSKPSTEILKLDHGPITIASSTKTSTTFALDAELVKQAWTAFKTNGNLKPSHPPEKEALEKIPGEVKAPTDESPTFKCKPIDSKCMTVINNIYNKGNNNPLKYFRIPRYEPKSRAGELQVKTKGKNGNDQPVERITLNNDGGLRNDLNFEPLNATANAQTVSFKELEKDVRTSCTATNNPPLNDNNEADYKTVIPKIEIPYDKEDQDVLSLFPDDDDDLFIL